MPIIKPNGLLRGERIGALSDEARLYWPFFYAGSNGHGRFEMDYQKIIHRCFAQFHVKPSVELVRRLLREYRDNDLLFLYTAPSGQKWAAWDSAARQSFYSREDKESPAPDPEAFAKWRDQYRSKKARAHDSFDIDSDEDDGAGAVDSGSKEQTISVLYRPVTNRPSISTSASLHQSSETSTHQDQVETPDFRIEELARETCAALLPDHPKMSPAGWAEAAVLREIQAFHRDDPQQFCTALRKTHAEHVSSWREELARNRNAFVPLFHVWVRDRYYLHKREAPTVDPKNLKGVEYLRWKIAESERLEALEKKAVND